MPQLRLSRYAALQGVCHEDSWMVSEYEGVADPIASQSACHEHGRDLSKP